MIYYWHMSNAVREATFLPKYYNPLIESKRAALEKTHRTTSIGELLDARVLSLSAGHELGKESYGTGDVPFVRTSDISNWEIKSAPKQGVSADIYAEYAGVQDVQIGDILFVRDGTYLIGTNCFITEVDKEILYQSHVTKIRVTDPAQLDPHLLFLALNNNWVQSQIRSFQFTADIIDTIGRRIFEIQLPIPRDVQFASELIDQCKSNLEIRAAGKAFIKHCSFLLEDVLHTGSAAPIGAFLNMSAKEKTEAIRNKTVTAEFGPFSAFWLSSASIVDGIFLPSYYSVDIRDELHSLSTHCQLLTIQELVEMGVIQYHTGDEIGKAVYGTGRVPFLRTSDFANWEISHSPKQTVSEEVYAEFAAKQDVRENDVLLVRDGTYLVGSSCIITSEDVQSLYCGGLFKFRVSADLLDPFLLLGLLNSFIVKRQIRSKQFTRDVIDTIGNRIQEVVLPIPKEASLRHAISDAVQNAVRSRVQARDRIAELAQAIAP